MKTNFLLVAVFSAAVWPGVPAFAWQDEAAAQSPDAEDAATNGDAAEEESTRREDMPEFDVDPEKVAFWVSLEGDDRHAIPVTIAEWDRYMNTISPIYDPTSPGSFLYQALWNLLEAKVMMFEYAEKLPQLKKRSREVFRKLDRGIKWKRVVRLYSEDMLSRSTGGQQAPFQRTLKRYPLELEVFQLEEGEVGGPYFTKFGAEIYRVERRMGEPNTRSEALEIRYILMKWGPGLTADEWSELRRRIRLQTDHERFRQILPPGMQANPPATFGPTDIAPMGEPSKPLSSTDEIKSSEK